jgi:hypothetical protein
MNKLDKLFGDIISQTQNKINLYAVNNNQHGERTQIEVLKAVKMLYEVYKEEYDKKVVNKQPKKSTKKASNTVKKQ